MTIIIATDLGHFKAYRITKDPMEKSPRVKLIEGYDSIEGHGKLGEKLSDSAGRFMKGGGKKESAKGAGERHNIGLESEKKIIRMIARDIDDLLVSEKCEKWYLAAAEQINSQIMESLTPQSKSILEKNITSDLTNINKSEILSYFTEKAP
jgi:hypothetical protein